LADNFAWRHPFCICTAQLISDISNIKSQLKLSQFYIQVVKKVNGIEGFHITTFLD